jgi:hypothetical protein
LIGLLLDEEIAGKELDELANMVAEDPVLLEELRRQLIMADHLEQYEDEQRSAEAFVKGLETRIGATAGSEQFVEQVMKTVHRDQPGSAARTTTGKIMNISPIEPEVSWLGGGRFWAIAAGLVVLLCIIVGLKTNQMNNLRAKPEQAFLFAPKDLAPGAPAAFRVFVRDGSNEEPVADAQVEVSLAAEGGDEVWMVNATTDEDGFAKIEKQVPDDLGKPVLIGGGIHHPYLITTLGSQADLHLSICDRFFIGTIANKYTESRRRPWSQVFRREQECLLRLGSKIVHLIGFQPHNDAQQYDQACSNGPKTAASQPAHFRFNR